jgi:tetratricopeptide (TPR) repeat protein
MHESLPPEKRAYFGWQAGQRVLPYRMQDRYSRERSAYTMKVVVLENDYLKATFWVELGGRLMSLIYKPLNRELLYNNPVFQPANLAVRNAWFAGGIEWNVAHYGHSCHTCSPVFAAAIIDEQGQPGLRLYEFDRLKGFLWHTDFYLPSESEFLIAFTQVVNPQAEDSSMYWWTNIAVPELPGVRILAPTEDALYIDSSMAGFGFAQLPELPSLPGKDPTYSLNWPNANEFFFQCDQADIPWEAALDKDGTGLIEASTPRLKYRKLFCWGTHQGGRHWQEFLAAPDMAYLEIQAGLAPTQLHHLPFAAGEGWHWTEFFGYLQADPVQVHDPNYSAAWRAVDAVLKQRISAEQMAVIEQGCLERSKQHSSIILQHGSGWGALEQARAGQRDNLPEAFYFPAASLGPEQAPWLALLNQDCLPAQPPEEIPGDWQVQTGWRERLAASLTISENRNWFALLHYGVMLAEIFDAQGAADAWRESIEKQPSAWAYRNLALLAQSNGQVEESIALYQRAWQLAQVGGLPLEALAHEYLSLLVQARQFVQARAVFGSLPKDASDSDRVQILWAMTALQLNQLDAVEQVLQRSFATVREGQVDLTNLWFEMWQRRAALESDQPLEEISLDEIKAAHPAPAAIDFRSGE